MKGIFKKEKKAKEPKQDSSHTLTHEDKVEAVTETKPKKNKDERDILNLLSDYKQNDGWMHLDSIERSFQYVQDIPVPVQINKLVAGRMEIVTETRMEKRTTFVIPPFAVRNTLDALLRECQVEYGFSTHSYRITDLGRTYLSSLK